jgi:hypothetical protein
MTALSWPADPARLLAAWEAGAAAPELARGCAVLAAAGLADPAGVLDLPVGEVGARAVRCHLDAFGPRVDALTTCAGCGTTLDVALSLTALLPGPAASGGENGHGGPVPARTLSLAGGTVTVRPPTVRDLLAAAADRDPRGALVRRCAQRPGGSPVAEADLGADGLALVDEALEDLASLGLITVRSRCPDCGEQVVAVLDPAALLWQQVQGAAPALLREVATLAAAFGWDESAILALPAFRRHAYLQLANVPTAGR